MSASIPSLFNRYDFFGSVLPGYVILLVYIYLYNPSLFANATTTSLNILWTVVFLVAGPAIGLTLTQAFRIALWYLGKAWSMLRRKDGKPVVYSMKRDNFVYYWIRINTETNTNQLNEIDLAEAMTDFDLTTGASLIGLGVGKLYYAPISAAWAAALVVAGLLLLVGTYYEIQGYDAVMQALWDKLNLKLPPEVQNPKPSQDQPAEIPPPKRYEAY